jgi:hypothetical protein
MTFNKLADRCLLFIDERKQMLIQLLKEAELEMTRKCNMYEDTRRFTCSGAESYGLPSNYKQILFIQYNGDKLHPIGEGEVPYNSSGDVQTGTPSGYFIRNNGIHLNYKPSSGTLKLTYYGTVENIQDTSSTPSPIVPSMYHRDLCDYAIAIAAAREFPQIHQKHWMLWQNNINEIINEDANRELIGTIKREV